jgi:hypothetical protein
LIGWNWLEWANLIHTIQGLHNNVEVLDEKTDVFGSSCVPERIIAFLVTGRFKQDQTFIQDHVQSSNGEIGVGLEELVSAVKGPVIVMDDLMVQFAFVIESPDVVARGQAVA